MIESREETLVEEITKKFKDAQDIRSNWESHWQECYDFVIPQRNGFGQISNAGSKRQQKIYDATAIHAVDDLAASMLSELTPPWSKWFHLYPGTDVPEDKRELVANELDKANKVLQSHFDQSNFAVEIHQCYLDLVTAGTASLLFEESKPGEFSAFQFTAIPLHQLYLCETETGSLNATFRILKLSTEQLQNRFGEKVYSFIDKEAAQKSNEKFNVLEAIVPCQNCFKYYAVLTMQSGDVLIEEGHFEQSPFINFRWTKSPGENYGRSPVMRSLPDIKTANKVVELILKNASIAVTGIWQADDDGVLNPANIKLVPGTIIPKAVGSAGLKPLEMPGNFDVSQIILEDLRIRIKQALLADGLKSVSSTMTATEVLERSQETFKKMGATYGRLQSELLTPLIKRAYAILRRRGEIVDLPLDGKIVALKYTSPLAKSQSQKDIQVITSWIKETLHYGDTASSVVNMPKAARMIGETLGVPLLVEMAKEGLGKLDNPIAKKASKALQDVETAVERGNISDDDLKLAKEHIEKMRDYDRSEFETAMKEINESLRKESDSSDSYVRRMRPTFGYIMAATWAAQMFSIAYVIVDDPQNSQSVIEAMDSLSTIWSVGLSVLGIYVYKRSQEKKGTEGNTSFLKAVDALKKPFKK